jgi:hypothetical protein
MTERKDTPETEPTGKTCQWCFGSGFVQRALAYVGGPDPFAGQAETVIRAGQCKHCRGTGVYDSALDPTVEHGRRESPPEVS